MNMLEEFDYQLNKLKEKLSHSDSRRSHSPQRPRAYENEQRGRDQHDYRGGQDQNHRSRDYHDQRDRRSFDHYDHDIRSNSSIISRHGEYNITINISR